MEEKKNNSIEYDEDGIPKLEYIQVGEFLLPNLALEEVDGYIGRWGMMRKRYLQNGCSGRTASGERSCTR